MIRVLVWNEYQHERQSEYVRGIYPNGIHNTIADFLRCDDVIVKTATLDEENCGITREVLEETDVLIWWGHMAHDRVPQEVSDLVCEAIHAGMGAIFLHSAHHSKPFKALMGTTCNLTWRESKDSEILWVTEPAHPIARGINRFIRLEREETYGEPFVIPNPDKLLFLGAYSGGEAFRSGCLYERGNGKIFYFQPGHETCPTFHVKEIQTVIRNAVRFVAPAYRLLTDCPNVRKVTDEKPYVRA